MKDTKRSPLIYIVGFSLLTIILLNVPFGRYVLYPFIILGTWFHEISHGFAAIAMGGELVRLEIYGNGSGLAVHTSNLFLGPVGNAIVAAAGPMGPTFAGSIMLVSSKSEKASGVILFLLGLFLILSVVLWVRSVFGIIFITLFGIISIYSSVELHEKHRKFVIQFLAVQAFTSLYLSIGYLYSGTGTVDGSSFSSDTQVIAQNLLLPNWFWASAIIIVSIIIIVLSIRNVTKNRNNN
jgi:hypothetical protein